ncbi:MAG: hypothetical protein MRK01_00620 [Candidatus Scalindua sp.]|nr:hypothetical protein [Candidatus Scalindua sp.]
MPITRELENVKKLESAGFSHEQAETLTDVIERSHVDSQSDLKEYFRNELSKQIIGLDNKLSDTISDLRVEISRELKDLLIKIFGIIVGTTGVAVTILKLFP